MPGTIPAGTRTGPVSGAQTMMGGNNTAIAARLRTARGEVFVKGLPRRHPQFWSQRWEAELGVHVAPTGPRLLWHVEAGG